MRAHVLVNTGDEQEVLIGQEVLFKVEATIDMLYKCMYFRN